MSRRRKPDWLAVRPPSGERFREVRDTLREYDLHTVCEEASCPNRGECWSGREGPGTATVMLLGERCSRGCNFCDVATGGMDAPDPAEPANVASALAAVDLDYAVLTSVDRDDLPDGGAAHIAETVREIRARAPETLVEVLAPDFGGDLGDVATVLDAGPDVFAHNVETVERLQRPVRDPRAGYEQSLSVLARAAREPGVRVKTSLMLGLGERTHEVYRALSDCRAAGVEVVTLGQYLRPSGDHLPVEEFIHPATFETWRAVAEAELGFDYCASGPLVRSSYRAGEVFVEALDAGDSVAAAREAARR